MDIPRRNRIDQNSVAELAVRDVIQKVEAFGCDPLLTDAVVLLDQAREKIADYVDAQIAKIINP